MHREAIVDLARGAALPSSVAAAAEAHVDGCPACAAELRRQRELTAGLHALAASVRHEAPAADSEARVLAAFAAAHTAADAPPAARPSWTWFAAAAAAAAVIAAAYVVGGSRGRSVEPGIARRADAAPSPPIVAEAPKPVAKAPDEPANPRSVRNVPRPSRPAAPGNGTRTFEFAAIPGAAGLPDFESGSIVRVELPVAALPAYGVEIAPDAARSQVQADMLVGQDGHARAIRLVAPTGSR
jgi:hypothetical protein